MSLKERTLRYMEESVLIRVLDFMKDSMKPVWGDELLTEFPWEDKE